MEFLDKIEHILEKIEQKEVENIKAAAKLMFECFEDEHIVHVFATGHSHMFCEELFYRAGGLVQIDPILIPELMQHEGAITSTKLERVSGKARAIFESLDLKPCEPFIIVSNSGINNVPVEMAEICKAHGHPVIVVTSMDTSVNLKPRNTINKHLYDFADVLIDNHVPYGDGVIDKNYALVGSSSSIIGSYIAQRLVLEVINLYEEKGIVPPIYISANLPGGDDHNQTLYEKYQGRIKSLR